MNKPFEKDAFALPQRNMNTGRLARRQRKEIRFRLYGLAALLIAISFLVILFASIIVKGHSAIWQTAIQLEIYLDQTIVDPLGEMNPIHIAKANYNGLIKSALRTRFPDVKKRRDKRRLYGLVSIGGPYQLQKMVLENPQLIGSRQKIWFTASDDIDMYMKGFVDANIDQSQRRVKDVDIAWVKALKVEGAIEKKFNIDFFTKGDSREPEMAGIWGAVKGSFFTLVITLVLAFPLGVAAALYLEEFAPKNRWTESIEVNINNLAAVPSIVFGLLGLAMFLNFFGLPRSAPLVGGIVLALMTLPTIIIVGRSALKAVPPSIREAALGMGASSMQVVFHHVLPLAMPGILTGAIIGMARALGESAPLLMIGMVAFIVDVPTGFTEPATALPVQVYLWADSPERAFVERTSAAILVLLGFLVAMNLTAVILRHKFERKW